MTIYAHIEGDIVLKFVGTADPADFVGPPDPPPDEEGDFQVVAAMPAARPNRSAQLKWVNGGPQWIDARDPAQTKLAAIDAIDSAAEAARAAILVKSTNTIEYQIALTDAIKYRDAGFAGLVPRGVSGWSHAKRRQGWTDQRAAEDILATEARWMIALYFIRDTRLDAKEMVRDAVTNAEVDTLLATFTATLTAAMQGVQ